MADIYDMYRLVYLLFPVLLLHCGESKGTFAFFPANESALTEMQKTYYYPPRFNRFQSPILFSENRTIWVAYRPASRSYSSPYALSLSQKSLGWMEINLKTQSLAKGSKYLVNRYKNLPAGKYLLRVAHDNRIVDSIEFEVTMEESSREDYIDYDAPVEVVMDSEPDDIRLLSK